MALSKQIYAALEDVVGVENICDDPVIMPSYHQTEFAAIILPKNTAEVQAIVKICNKYKLPFRPICTGWSGQFAKGSPDQPKVASPNKCPKVTFKGITNRIQGLK